MISATLSRRLALLSFIASALGLAGCGGGGGGGSGTAQIRTLNLTTDLAAVDLYTDTTKQFSAQTPDALSTYNGLDAASYTLKVTAANDAQVLLNGSYTLAKDQHYTAIIWGRQAGIRLSTIPEDEDTTSITSGNSRLRIFNATTDSGTVDVFLTATSTDLSETTPSQGNLVAGTLSGFRDYSVGSYRLRVTGAGDPNDLRLDIPNISLGNQQYATLVLTAGAGGVLVNGSLVLQQGALTSMKNSKARARVVASVSGAGNVNVGLGATTLVGSLRSPGVGPYALVDSGSQTLTVRINGTATSTSTPALASGADYTLLAYGTAAAGKVALLTDDNRVPSGTTGAKIRLVNGLSLSDPLSLQIVYQTKPTTSNIVSGAASGYDTFTAASSSQLDITSPTALDPLYSLTAVSGANLLQAQGVYTVFMLDGQTNPAGRLSKDR